MPSNKAVAKAKKKRKLTLMTALERKGERIKSPVTLANIKRINKNNSSIAVGLKKKFCKFI
jgi:hypothetical protein